MILAWNKLPVTGVIFQCAIIDEKSCFLFCFVLFWGATLPSSITFLSPFLAQCPLSEFLTLNCLHWLCQRLLPDNIPALIRLVGF